jgi:hypothetical protein
MFLTKKRSFFFCKAKSIRFSRNLKDPFNSVDQFSGLSSIERSISSCDFLAEELSVLYPLVLVFGLESKVLLAKGGLKLHPNLASPLKEALY